ncbi:nucleotidyltransferase family protein [Paenibacillus xanthanilyticus]|uniref:Nucleotidyltransferase family protein n=1 Tax=Paenibacillus xanthanilyticus TaxID=1783531 RepID=A0ABV8KCG1_9BACL
MGDEETVRRALTKIAASIEESGAKWLVGGSAGLQLRGLPLSQPPRDLDLYADLEEARIIHDRLIRYAIDQPYESVTGMYRSMLSHYEIEGVAVELVGGFEVHAGGGSYEVKINNLLYHHREDVACGGYSVGIVPLAHELWFNVLRAREDRTSLIMDAIRRNPGPHLAGLRAVERSGRFKGSMVADVHKQLNLPEWGTFDER